eukprot:TRINITY_DN55074_c0_g1_i1.p1 TRINITY_DN55074_c0_g1~~TRINITY_DN55074_c0_g1_i1.p1  ORF type:complete len:359 (+),score=139.61 TRINITY_DN55074_c0_g1_i1:85-1077(+)
MAAYYGLQRVAADDMMHKLCAAVNEAEAARAQEEAAALRIQGVRRMHAARRRFQLKRRAACEAQRAWRGYHGRMRAAERRCEVALTHQRALYAHFACLIQKTFRGYYHRKWVSDFFAQKRYIREVEARSRQVREASVIYEQQLLREEEERAKQERSAHFDRVARSMRHLCSTATQPGVLRPAATQDGLQLHPELRGSFGQSAEDALRSFPVPRRKFKPDLPTKGPSLRATSKYGAAEEAVQVDRLLHKRLRLAGDFVVGHVAGQPHMPSIRHGDGTFERPVKFRSHLNGQPRVSDRPFVSSTKTDRGFDGTVHPELARPPTRTLAPEAAS